MKNYYKRIDKNGQLEKVGFSSVESSEEAISNTEYCMMKCAIKIFRNGEDPEKIKTEDWWK